MKKQDGDDKLKLYLNIEKIVQIIIININKHTK